jgi:membrane-bound lytic murein transglycosylase D
MTIAHAFSLPALAISTSLLSVHLGVPADLHVNGEDHESASRFGLSPALHAAVFAQAATILTPRQTKPAAAVTAVVADIWERLRAGYGIPVETTPSAQARVEAFHRHARLFEQIMQRSEPYLFHVLDRVEARGLPAELALLPVIESAYDPFARSTAGATGIWQFMPATAREAGLREDWWYDGRRDFVAATEAALDYLTMLQQRYDGDWLLALAAYNAGSARVNRTIRRNRSQGRPVDFWHLPLPEETREYVPKLLALRAIIADPAGHGIALPELANSSYFTSVDTGGQIDLQVAARLAGASLDKLQRLNPGLTRSITPPDSKHQILIPRASALRFRLGLALLPADQRVQSIRYRVRSGDTLSEIALNSRTTVSRLRKLNQLESSRIMAGKLLIVPLNGHDA